MNIFLDTTVLVASCAQTHPHYAHAAPAVRRVVAGKDTGFLSTHSIAEMYAALTRMPVQPRIHSTEAARMILSNIVAHFKAVPLTREDYLGALEQVANSGWAGAKIDDALLLYCAEKCGAERVYTFNLSDFREMASAALCERICAP